MANDSKSKANRADGNRAPELLARDFDTWPFLRERMLYVRALRKAGYDWDEVRGFLNVDAEGLRKIWNDGEKAGWDLPTRAEIDALWEKGEKSTNPKVAVVSVADPISTEDATAPAELEKQQRFGEELAHVLGHLSCEEHGDCHGIGAKAWHVGIEMRFSEAVRDRFYVTLDADGKRIRNIGPMSADVVNHILMFVESGLQAGLPGSEAGSCSRTVADLSKQ